MVKYEKKRYVFIVEGYDIDYKVFFVDGVNPSNALIEYCKYSGLRGARLEAICSVVFESAMELANGWLSDTILQVFELGNVVFGKENVIDIVNNEDEDMKGEKR